MKVKSYNEKAAMCRMEPEIHLGTDSDCCGKCEGINNIYSGVSHACVAWTTKPHVTLLNFS